MIWRLNWRGALGVACLLLASMAFLLNPQLSRADSTPAADEALSAMRAAVAGPGEAISDEARVLADSAAGQQVMLEPKIVETSNSAARELGIDQPVSHPFEVPEAVEGTGALRSDKSSDFGLKGGLLDSYVNVDVNEKPVADVITLLAAKAKLNLLFNPKSISGIITLHLENVKVGETLESVLKNNGLSYIQEANLIRIVPASQVGRGAVELKTDVIVLNWVKASDLEKSLRPFISQEGQIQANNENNSIILTDTPPNLDKMRGLVAQLDVPEKQVLIEMRLVDVGKNFLKAAASNLEIYDASNPSNAFHRGQDQFAELNPDFLDGTTDDLHDFFLGTPGLPVGFDSAFTRIGTLKILGYEFPYAFNSSNTQTNSNIEVLANPRVITLNNLPARIQIKENIPYVQAQTTQQGANVPGFPAPETTTSRIEFEEAGQDISVTPTITANGYVRMNIQVLQQIFRGRQGSGALDPPRIDEREATTNVIVRDGATIALGGLESHRISDSETGTPWLMSIPVLKWFFRDQQNEIERTSLILLVRPQIVRVDQSELSEHEKYWFDGVARRWDVPDQFFDDWNGNSPENPIP